jgi:hypothetical protein
MVSPTLTLLAGRTEWSKAGKAQQKTLSEISRGKAADAITDAGTALEESLKLIGCAGTGLGPLIKSARAKGLLAPHDGKLTGSLDDAWLIVHVVEALILRLTEADRR